MATSACSGTSPAPKVIDYESQWGRWLGCNSPCCSSGARFACLSAHKGQYYQPCRLSGGGVSVHIAGWLELRERFLHKVMLMPALASFMVRNAEYLEFYLHLGYCTVAAFTSKVYNPETSCEIMYPILGERTFEQCE